MAVTVRLPGSLRETVGGTGKVQAHGRTLGEIIADLDARFPGFAGRVLDEQGGLRTYVTVFIGERDARAIGGTNAPVPEGSEVMLVPAMAGGRDPA
jgi:molybdopterin converting factor small subunit